MRGRYSVTCPDGIVRHEVTFERRSDAETFAEWGHCCLAAHLHRINIHTDTDLEVTTS